MSNENTRPTPEQIAEARARLTSNLDKWAYSMGISDTNAISTLIAATEPRTKASNVAGLWAHQIRRLELTRDDMLGWQLVGYVVAVGPDGYLWPNDTHVDGDKADVFATPEEAMAQFQMILDSFGEEEDLVVNVLYKKGDLWDWVPCQ